MSRPLPIALIVVVSLSGAVPIVIDSPTANFVTSATGTRVESFEAPGAATVDALAADGIAPTPTTVQ